MNIMVFDVPAESGGALSILNDFYQEVIENDDKNINWIFVLSKPEYKEFDNITVLNFPWVKNSWFHRLYFDRFVAPKLVKKYNIDRVFSLQNIIVPKTKVEQVVYIHQSLPFDSYKFNIMEDLKLWTYQNLIGKKIFSSIKQSEKVIVQTNWMKKACTEKVNVQKNKIKVIPPKINLNIEKNFDKNNRTKTFFYPAGASYYKNHRLIIEASKLLEASNINDYKIILTLNGNENKNIKGLYKEVKKYNLPVEFAGRLEREEVFNLYTKSYLLFPSYIETFGLPMLEAKLHKTIILASDKAFSHEILDDYENAYFFDPFDAKELMKYMKKLLVGEISYKKVNSVSKSNNNSLYSEVIKKLN